MGEAGPIPHLPPDGKVVRFTPKSAATELASGASLIVDVEPGSVASYMPCHKESGTCRRPPRTRTRRHPRTREGFCGSRGTEASRPSSRGSTGRRPSTSSARPPSLSRSRARSSGSTMPADAQPVQGDDPQTPLIGGGRRRRLPLGDILAGPLRGGEAVLRSTRPAGARSGAYVGGHAVARGVRAVGLDVAEGMLELARQRVRGVELLRAHADELPFDGRFADAGRGTLRRTSARHALRALRQGCPPNQIGGRCPHR